ncbi:carbohydrate porin [Methylobacterium haplocladii]|uniref:Porin n=1 Tax=Methylobacterium haplocladii TaxID=1176176 RepID=A0A512IW37_9HYPH|nr:carbohydrate porin [Methylobacterium haplocladii]GEP01922.1 porin [Methylobacterium haplocladii]GLS61445.1 porin [Methylobacterium haplocladii]
MRRLISGPSRGPTIALALCLVGATTARAEQSRPVYEGAGGDPRISISQPESTSQASGGYTRSIEPSLGPLGDPLGLRPELKARGIEYSLTYIADLLGNPSGGVRRGTAVSDRLNLRLNLDLERLAGWEGATVHANAYFIHGTGLSRYYVGNLLEASVIEALPSSRLYVLWYDQQLFDNTLGLRIGQQAADTEFFVSQTATAFVNSTFGWPAITGLNLPSGGPAYPLAAPAIRAKYVPGNGFSLQVGLYDGDPAGANRPGDDPEAQRLNRTGTNFRVHDPALVLAEATYAYNTKPGSEGLPGDITLGGWQHFGRFDSLRTDITGLPLADPNATGIGRPLRGNAGLYAVYDQTLYREAGKDDEGLGFFVRAAYSPTRSSLVTAYVDTGLAYKGLIPGRDDDTVGVSVAHARLSDDARRADNDTIRVTGQPMPRRRAESVIEATYQAVVVPGFTVQPDLQVILHPGGGIANPRDANAGRVKNAVVLGVQAAVQY